MSGTVFGTAIDTVSRAELLFAQRVTYPTTENTFFINSTTDALSVSKPFAVVSGIWSDSNYWYDSSTWSDS